MITSFFKRQGKRGRSDPGSDEEAQGAGTGTKAARRAEASPQTSLSIEAFEADMAETCPPAATVHPSWHALFREECGKPYFRDLMAFVAKQRSSCTVFPPEAATFAAFQHTPLDSVRVVVLGQDPYHGHGQAHGLSFSVPAGVKPLPPSLRNIVKEAATALPAGSANTPGCGDLTCWAQQGVLLLNTVLTVRAGAAHSHAKQGWETFTDAAIRHVSKQCKDVAFLLWGKPAQSKAKLVSTSRHLVLRSPHPSPLSAFRGFFGCGHFRQVNEHLTGLGEPEIDWTIRPVSPAPLEAGEPESSSETPSTAAAAAAAAEGSNAP